MVVKEHKFYANGSYNINYEFYFIIKINNKKKNVSAVLYVYT